MAKRTDATATEAKPRTPKMATSEKGATHPRIEVSPPYYLVFHPERWTVLAGRLVPALSKAKLVDGVDQVTVRKDGRISFARARARIEEQGKTVVPWEWAPDGASYIQALDTRPEAGQDPVETWISVWETARVGSALIGVDLDGYSGWLSELVSTGKLPACPETVAQKLLDGAVERLEKARAQAAKLGGHGSPLLRVKALEAEVKAIETHLAGAAPGAKAVAKRKAPVVEDAEEAA